MKRSMKFACCIFITVISAAAQPSMGTFQQLASLHHMRFAMPSHFTAVPVKANRDIVYDFAMRSEIKKLEIRYRIVSIDRKDRNANAVHETMLATMAMNISNGKTITPQRYPTTSVKKEFGADAGCTGVVLTQSEFGNGYTMCMISVIHKDNVADAYTYYLFDEQDALIEALTNSPIYHALRFE